MAFDGILQIYRPIRLPRGTLTTLAEVNAAIVEYGPLAHLVEARGWITEVTDGD
jgi:hypothetical protein